MRSGETTAPPRPTTGGILNGAASRVNAHVESGLSLGFRGLVRCGGHFAGAQVPHWSGGCESRGAVLSGDVLQVVADRRWVSFLYSYPNLIPLPAAAVRRIGQALAPFSFERLYGGWGGNASKPGPEPPCKNRWNAT